MLNRDTLEHQSVCMKNSFRLLGRVKMNSDLSLEELASILSDRIFGGARFAGRDLNVYDEVPAVFIAKGILGLSVTLFGYSNNEEPAGYYLEILPDAHFDGTEQQDVSLNNYLEKLLESKLKDIANVIIIQNE